MKGSFTKLKHKADQMVLQQCYRIRGPSAPGGRPSIVKAWPLLFENIVSTLTSLQAAGTMLNVVIARSVIYGIIRAKEPALLFDKGGKFKVTREWVRRFVLAELG